MPTLVLVRIFLCYDPGGFISRSWKERQYIEILEGFAFYLYRILQLTHAHVVTESIKYFC